jgi:very-short-patch-repair endonuclease
MKTRLADILACPDHLWTTPHGQRLAQKHVDFVLYDPVTTAIVAVIELDDRSHRQAQRRLRDQFVNQALRAAGVPLLRVKAARTYDLAVTRADIAKIIAMR